MTTKAPESLKGTRIGVVESDKRDKTRKVVVRFLAKHAKYGKYSAKRTVLHVHDEGNESRAGDTVEVGDREVERHRGTALLPRGDPERDLLRFPFVRQRTRPGSEHVGQRGGCGGTRLGLGRLAGAASRRERGGQRQGTRDEGATEYREHGHVPRGMPWANVASWTKRPFPRTWAPPSAARAVPPRHSTPPALVTGREVGSATGARHRGPAQLPATVNPSKRTAAGPR